MSVTNTPRKAGPYTGNNTDVQYTFGFKVFADSDLVVTRAVIATGAESTLVLTTDYTVTRNADQDVDPGGYVTLTTALADTYMLTLTSQVPYSQPATFTNTGGFYPAVLNDSLDRLAIQVQQLAEEVSRSVKVGFSGLVSPDELVSTITTAASTATAGAASAAASAGAALDAVTDAQDAITAANAAIAGALQKSGGTMTGALTLAGDAAGAFGAVPKQQAESIASTAAATAETNAKNTGLGYAQTWQDLTASRATSTTYYNTTGRPIMIDVVGLNTGSSNLMITVNGMSLNQFGVTLSSGSAIVVRSAIVPPGASYSVTGSGVTQWNELR